MSKTKGTVQKAELPPPVNYPKSLLVRYFDHGTPDQFLVAGETPADIAEVDPHGTQGTVKVARYVLVGTGVIECSAPQYVEHVAS